MVEQRNNQRVFCGDYITSGFIVLNVSSGGALLTSEKQKEVGDTIVLPLRLGPLERIKCEAKVKWCKPTACGTYMLGIAFNEPHTDSLNHYVEFLSTLENIVA